MLPTNRRSTHPGEILREEFMKPHGWYYDVVAYKLGVSDGWLRAFCAGKRRLSTRVANGLGVLCETSATFWINLQEGYDKSPTD